MPIHVAPQCLRFLRSLVKKSTWVIFWSIFGSWPKIIVDDIAGVFGTRTCSSTSLNIISKTKLTLLYSIESIYRINSNVSIP